METLRSSSHRARSTGRRWSLKTADLTLTSSRSCSTTTTRADGATQARLGTDDRLALKNIVVAKVIEKRHAAFAGRESAAVGGQA